ncbi:MAG: 2-C-methyl-D-erythritol 4-phosphate cytidylyltransferase [Dehalococcoidales bacterium]|jgi:2-C-methyl-D-erythritol 4-phosphate cytidylyltransferase|nr:2-C-methyl-D-erythritol 4-phosphate cytidylyltransferase [Dehalococcoidales bacterium]
MQNNQKVGAIIVAAGRGERMSGLDKMFAPLGGKPVLARVVNVFEQCNSIDQIVVALSAQALEQGKKLVAQEGFSKVTDVCLGGKLRQNSVAAGLSRLKNCHWVVIHDGARPLVTVALIETGLGVAGEIGAAVAAVPITDTIKVAGDDRFVQKTPLRQNLWAVQTPQVFRSDIITQAYRKIRAEVTDDASLVERLGCRIKLYMGSYDNIKITNVSDLALAEIIWREHEI